MRITIPFIEEIARGIVAMETTEVPDAMGTKLGDVRIFKTITTTQKGHSVYYKHKRIAFISEGELNIPLDIMSNNLILSGFRDLAAKQAVEEVEKAFTVGGGNVGYDWLTANITSEQEVDLFDHQLIKWQGEGGIQHFVIKKNDETIGLYSATNSDEFEEALFDIRTTLDRHLIALIMQGKKDLIV